jgi:Methyltransferase domain
VTLRQSIADGPASIGERMRARRWDVLLSTFPRLAEYDVLDLGGTAGSWLRKDARPRSLTLLNLEATELTVDAAGAALPEWITIRTGDACTPPQDIAERRFDLVFSNSLIEHVGGPAKRQAMADFVKLAAPRFWIQTPYRYFPIEPHWIFPLFQFLPLAAKAHVSQIWPLMHTRSESWDSAVGTALGVDLVSITELRYLLPEATILRERFAGLTKSVIAVRT